jgi:hypothetical protein
MNDDYMKRYSREKLNVRCSDTNYSNFTSYVSENYSYPKHGSSYNTINIIRYSVTVCKIGELKSYVITGVSQTDLDTFTAEWKHARENYGVSTVLTLKGDSILSLIAGSVESANATRM